MAVIINNVSATTFSLNGVNYNKVYQPLASGTTSISILNTFDTRYQLLGPTHYSEFTIDSSTYGSQSATLTALLGVVYSGVSGGGSVSDWGDIGGILSNQVDLQAALDGKQDIGTFAAWANITGKPTTIAGYGITDAYTKTEADGKYALLTDSRFLNTTQKTDLTDLGDTSLHFHSTDRARANHTGTQAISTITGLQTALDGKAPTTRLISAGTGLSGGGDLSVDRTLSLDTTYTDTLYPRLNTTETISGIWTFSARPAFNGGASGSTSPFTVDSNQVVTNLNADLLDGLQASQFLRADASDTTTGELTAGSFKTGLWTIDTSAGGHLEFRYNGTLVLTLNTSGAATFTGNVSAG